MQATSLTSRVMSVFLSCPKWRASRSSASCIARAAHFNISTSNAEIDSVSQWYFNVTHSSGSSMKSCQQVVSKAKELRSSPSLTVPSWQNSLLRIAVSLSNFSGATLGTLSTTAKSHPIETLQVDMTPATIRSDKSEELDLRFPCLLARRMFSR